MNSEELKQKENQLYDNLYNLLYEYADKRASFDPTDTSVSSVIADVKTSISKCNSDRKIEILDEVIKKTKFYMNMEDGTKYIFYFIGDYSAELANKKKKRVRKIENKEPKENNKNSKDQVRKQELIGKINEYLKTFDIADREMLFSLEKDLNKKIISNIGAFRTHKSTAVSDVMSRLYIGFYGKNQSQLKDELNTKGINISKSAPLSKLMNDDLLKYRLTALALARESCRERKKYIKPKTIDSHYNIGEYNKLLHNIYLIGKTVANEYQKDFGMAVKESIIEDTYNKNYNKRYQKMLDNPQYMLDEMLEFNEEPILEPLVEDKTKKKKK